MTAGANDEGVGVSSADPFQTSKITQSDFAITGDFDQALRSIRVHLNAKGFNLHELECGGYLVARWGMARELPCLRAVGNMLRRIGGQQQ